MSNERKQQLHISEVQPTDSISVTAMMGEKKVELSATYAELTEEQMEFLNVNYGNHYLPVELITQEVNGEEVPVSFDGQNSVLHVVVANPSGVYKFEHILIRKTTLPGEKTFHLINAISTIGIRFNRRRGVRVNIDSRMMLEQGEEKFQILVREISYCGFSFINLSPNDVDTARPFLLHVIERDDEDKSFTIGKFIGKVHRVEEKEGSGTIYGCILADKHANQLQRYIAMKQMEALTGKKAFVDIQKTSNSDRWRQEIADALGATLNDENEQDSNDN